MAQCLVEQGLTRLLAGGGKQIILQRHHIDGTSAVKAFALFAIQVQHHPTIGLNPFALGTQIGQCTGGFTNMSFGDDDFHALALEPQTQLCTKEQFTLRRVQIHRCAHASTILADARRQNLQHAIQGLHAAAVDGAGKLDDV